MGRARPWVLGGGCFAAALALNTVTGRHLERIGPGLAPARDLLFETLPFAAFPNLHGWGFAAFLAVLAFGVLRYEESARIPFWLWAYGLIIAVRAAFTTLTPLGVPAEAPSFEHYSLRGALDYFDFRHTFFFSGHTAFPFLGFLLARRPWVRRACLGFSLALGASVLLSRLHYSIDVFAAFFITAAVARLARRSWRALVPRHGRAGATLPSVPPPLGPMPEPLDP